MSKLKLSAKDIKNNDLNKINKFLGQLDVKNPTHLLDLRRLYINRYTKKEDLKVFTTFFKFLIDDPNRGTYRSAITNTKLSNFVENFFDWASEIDLTEKTLYVNPETDKIIELDISRKTIVFDTDVLANVTGLSPLTIETNLLETSLKSGKEKYKEGELTIENIASDIDKQKLRSIISAENKSENETYYSEVIENFKEKAIEKNFADEILDDMMPDNCIDYSEVIEKESDSIPFDTKILSEVAKKAYETTSNERTAFQSRVENMIKNRRINKELEVIKVAERKEEDLKKLPHNERVINAGTEKILLHDSTEENNLVKQQITFISEKLSNIQLDIANLDAYCKRRIDKVLEKETFLSSVDYIMLTMNKKEQNLQQNIREILSYHDHFNANLDKIRWEINSAAKNFISTKERLDLKNKTDEENVQRILRGIKELNENINFRISESEMYIRAEKLDSKEEDWKLCNDRIKDMQTNIHSIENKILKVIETCKKIDEHNESTKPKKPNVIYAASKREEIYSDVIKYSLPQFFIGTSKEYKRQNMKNNYRAIHGQKMPKNCKNWMTDEMCTIMCRVSNTSEMEEEFEKVILGP
jgi:hypothetical protein